MPTNEGRRRESDITASDSSDYGSSQEAARIAREMQRKVLLVPRLQPWYCV